MSGYVEGKRYALTIVGNFVPSIVYRQQMQVIDRLELSSFLSVDLIGLKGLTLELVVSGEINCVCHGNASIDVTDIVCGACPDKDVDPCLDDLRQIWES